MFEEFQIFSSADTLTENYSGEECRKDVCPYNLDKADQAWNSYLNQQANQNSINGDLLIFY